MQWCWPRTLHCVQLSYTCSNRVKVSFLSCVLFIFLRAHQAFYHKLFNDLFVFTPILLFPCSGHNLFSVSFRRHYGSQATNLRRTNSRKRAIQLKAWTRWTLPRRLGCVSHLHTVCAGGGVLRQSGGKRFEIPYV